MTINWQNSLFTAGTRALVFAIATLFMASIAHATVTVTDPTATLPDPMGEDVSVYTHNPYDEGKSTAARNIATTGDGQRNLRQTFQLSDTINVGEIILSLHVERPSDGLNLRIYEVEDIAAASWSPSGAPIYQFSFEELINTTDWMSIAFSGGDVFTLEQRDTGTQGYGFEFSDAQNANGANLGAIRYNNDGMDAYAAGSWYPEGGGREASRDMGLYIIGTAAESGLPGDVDGSGVIDLADLQLIADHFRQGVSSRAEGDLTNDGFVDFDDFDQWKQNYGGSLAEVNLNFLSVPEPAALSLLFAMAGLLTLLRRSR
ncbi:hypothetical protein Mal64_09030 [Pseudobythopirellula maris]|uniref:PEP-CTERM protein-sorting domain-containing protein n=1 Tax=Pseudobythopirellula maris TaxID=2527991 RepID=A0A5C5ZSJ1_9BACT|nr:PEP-CTERM sorting domain-containing protein [Pseudobythopirellula maris]TWT90512.1 hypothetical protein Mal64_09030 [Pseudobythopirellula maris]